MHRLICGRDLVLCRSIGRFQDVQIETRLRGIFEGSILVNATHAKFEHTQMIGCQLEE